MELYMPVYRMNTLKPDWKRCIRYMDCYGLFEQVLQKRTYEIVENAGTAPFA